MQSKIDEQKERDIEEKAQLVIDTAQQRSYEIISEARQTASQIVDGAEKVGEEMRRLYQNEYKASVERQVKAYEQMMQEIRVEALSTVQSMATDLKSVFSKELENFKHSLEVDANNSSQDLSSKLSQQWQQIAEGLEVYKKQRIANVDLEINTRVNEIAREVLGKSISREDQNETVKRAILEAKKKHGW